MAAGGHRRWRRHSGCGGATAEYISEEGGGGMGQRRAVVGRSEVAGTRRRNLRNAGVC